MGDLLSCVSRLVVSFNLGKPGYRLIVNGGGYQDVPELHFHLVSGSVERAENVQ
jgi:diadenosine tetraphosphate (Ap4A) HIT family hydrolase